jgi:hypothetical protein
MNEVEVEDILVSLSLEQLTNLGAIAFYAINDGTTLEHQWQRSKRRKPSSFNLTVFNDLTREDLIDLILTISLHASIVLKYMK